jgi:hypothetical protein
VLRVLEKKGKLMVSNTDALCAGWLEAKRAETKARDARLAIEAELAEAFEVPEEGTKTQSTENYKVTVGQPITRKLDVAAWETVKGKIAPALHPVKIELKADATGCKYLAKNEPDVWKAIAPAFTATPGKVSIKVEEK